VFALRIGAYQGDRLVGWSHGFQDGSDSYIMATSAVLPAYRRRGLYTKLVEAVLERTRAAGGPAGGPRLRAREPRSWRRAVVSLVRSTNGGVVEVS